MKKNLNRFLVQKVVFAKNIHEAIKLEKKGVIVEITKIGVSTEKLEPQVGFMYPSEYIKQEIWEDQ